MPAALWTALLLCCLPAAFAAPAKPLQKLENCTLVKTDWADGDSFRIKTADGKEHTIRLYGVDCIELHGSTETILRRLREQRSHFGITGAGGGAKASITLARSYADAARDHTSALLAKPFTLHTRFQDAMGDKRFKRVYGIVTCADGTDLACSLVRAGIARAYGYDSDQPDGKTSREAEAMLQDLELVAAKRGAGVWARTDWDKLAAERDAERRENRTSAGKE